MEYCKIITTTKAHVEDIIVNVFDINHGSLNNVVSLHAKQGQYPAIHEQKKYEIIKAYTFSVYISFLLPPNKVYLLSVFHTH
jgi:hypothetical protein